MQALIMPFIIICLVLAGCSVGAGTSAAFQSLVAQQLFSGQQCGGSEETVVARWIDEGLAYQELTGIIHGAVLGKPNKTLPKVDFASHGVLMVSMGRQSTTGYFLSLAKNEVKVSNEIATVNLTWQELQPGAMAAQMITSPCVLISLPKADFSKVRIVDQDGLVRGEALLPSSSN